jgi:hypothetical protein
LYARGVADGNPIKINGGYNDIMIEAWSAESAAPPVIKAKPVGGTYSLGAEAAPVSVSVDAVKDGGTLSYQWYVNETASNSGGTPVGGDSASYTPSTAAESTLYYYCVVSNNPGVGSSAKTKTSIATSAAAVTVIDDNAQTPIISPEGQPAANTAIAKGGTATLSVSARVTDGGTLSYQWYGGGAAISGATQASYTTPVMNADGVFYYYCVVTNTNNDAPGAKVVKIASSTAAVTVGVVADAQTPVITSQPSGVTIAPGRSATLYVNARVTDGGTLSYQWHGGGAVISGAVSSFYGTSALDTEGAYSYYCVITNTNNAALGAKTAAVTSSTATVTVTANPPPPALADAQTPVINSQPSGATISAGARASLSVSASVSDGGTLSYQWYNNTVASNAGGASIGGASSASYTTPALSAAGTYYYYCVIKNTNNAATGAKVATVGSVAAAVTVAAYQPPPPPPPPPPPADAQKPSIPSGGQPAANTFVATGGTATLTVSASVSDGGVLSYQWYSNGTASNAGGSAIASAVAASYTTPALTVDGEYYYYCVITNTNAGAAGAKTSVVTSALATVEVGAFVNAETPAIGAGGQPAASSSAAYGASVTLTVSASVSDGGSLSYQWYKNAANSSVGGTSLGTANGANTASYSTPTNLANGTHYYYCIVTNTNNTVNGSKTVTQASSVAEVIITVINAQTPTIATQPEDTEVPRNQALTLTVSASVSDGGTLTYQWYRNTANNTSGTIIYYATSDNYAVTTTSAGTTYYYVIVTNTLTNNGDGGTKTAAVTSDVAKVTVNPPVNVQTPTITTQPATPTSVSTLGSVTLSIVATSPDGGTLTYQWYRNTSSSTSSGTLITGETSDSYSPSVATAGTTYYYCIVSNTITDNGDGGVKSRNTTSSVARVNVIAPYLKWNAIPAGTGPGESAFETTSFIFDIGWGGPAGNEKFVAVGSSGKMAYSADGLSWTAILPGNHRGIAWGGPTGDKKFVAGTGSGILYSSDGVTWTEIPGGTGPGTSTFDTSNIWKIAWGGPSGDEKFVAVGNFGRMAYSPDGINWTAIPAGPGGSTFDNNSNIDGNGYIEGIAWGGPSGNEKFVAGGSRGMAYSSDGVTWTAISKPSNFGLKGITWGGPAGDEKFVAVGRDGMMAYSSDGINWTGISFGTGAGTSTFESSLGIYGIAWGGPAGNKKFIAGGGGGQMAYSADGVSWTKIPSGTGVGGSTFTLPLNEEINGIAWGGPVGNEKFVAVGYLGQMAWSTGELE